MFDAEQLGFLAGAEYRWAADLRNEEGYRVACERHGVTELPGPGPLPEQVSTGRWEDNDPPGVGR